jgi:methionyl-tRNA synthetase
VRDVPRAGDADFRPDLIAARANELADGLGNLVNRTIALVGRQRPAAAAPGDDETVAEAALLLALRAELPYAIDEALAVFDLRRAASVLWEVVSEANRFASATQPWELAKAARTGDDAAAARLDAVLRVLLDTCSSIAGELVPFLPVAAERISGALADLDPERGRALFPKVALA